MRQKAILDVVQEISDDSEIIAQLKRNTQLKEKYFTADRSEQIQVLTVLPGIDSPDLFTSICSGIYFSFNWAIISLSSKTAFYIITVLIQAFAFYTVHSTALVWTGERCFPDGILHRIDRSCGLVLARPVWSLGTRLVNFPGRAAHQISFTAKASQSNE